MAVSRLDIPDIDCSDCPGACRFSSDAVDVLTRLLFPEGRVRDERSLRLGLLYLLQVIGTRLCRALAIVS
jgi:hypothetical protein